MITGKDVYQELRDAKKVIDSDATIEEKIKVLFKAIEVCLKVVLGIRVSLVKVMEKLGVEKVKPRKPRKNEKEKQ